MHDDCMCAYAGVRARVVGCGGCFSDIARQQQTSIAARHVPTGRRLGARCSPTHPLPVVGRRRRRTKAGPHQAGRLAEHSLLEGLLLWLVGLRLRLWRRYRSRRRGLSWQVHVGGCRATPLPPLPSMLLLLMGRRRPVQAFEPGRRRARPLLRRAGGLGLLRLLRAHLAAAAQANCALWA